MQTVQIINEGKLTNGQHFQNQGQALQEQTNAMISANSQIMNGQIQLNGGMHQHHQMQYGVNNGRVNMSPTLH